ncbi:hypothetical protein EDD85DRAFT_791963 [Armillaria nabsnona]|nr:hypothetical protein EDD85DRAFT_791963 [Armillaria nabsnona]
MSTSTGNDQHHRLVTMISPVAPAIPPAAPLPLDPTDTVLPLPTARAITAIAEHAAEHVTRLPPPIQAIWSLAHQTASQTVPPSANAKGKCKACPASINPQKSRIELDIMIVPNIGEPDHVDDVWGYHQLALHADQTRTAYNKVFIPNHLGHRITLTPILPLLQQINSELRRAVKVGRLEVPRLDNFIANQEDIVYNSSYPWVWLAPQRCGNTYSFQPAGSLSGTVIMPSALVNLTQMFQPLPTSQENRFFLIVGTFTVICPQVEPLNSSDDEIGGALPNAPIHHASPSWSPPPVEVALTVGPRTPMWRHSTPNGSEWRTPHPSPMPRTHDPHRMIIFDWQRACHLAVDQHYTDLGYRIAGDTVEDITDVLCLSNGDFHILQLFEQQAYMRLYNTLLALSLVQLGQGFVVSPWVVLALIGSLDAFGQLSLNEIRVFSESDANTVACWYQVGRETRIDHHCAQHTTIQGLFTEALSVEITNCFVTIPLLQQLFQPFVTVEEVIPHLVYQSNGRHSLPVDIYKHSLVLLFKSHLESYLRGVGHPVASKGELVTMEQWEQEKDDSLVWAHLLLDAAWALPRPPAVPMWEF